MQGVRAVWNVSPGRGLHISAHPPDQSITGPRLSALRAWVLSARAVLRDEARETSDTVSFLHGGILSEWEGASSRTGSGREL